jgi:hypothetical protein
MARQRDDVKLAKALCGKSKTACKGRPLKQVGCGPLNTTVIPYRCDARVRWISSTLVSR